MKCCASSMLELVDRVPLWVRLAPRQESVARSGAVAFPGWPTTASLLVQWDDACASEEDCFSQHL